MNEGRLKECWERTKDNGVLCRAALHHLHHGPVHRAVLVLLPRGRADQD